MLGDPVRNPLGKGIVVERVAEVSYEAIDLEDFVDGSSVVAVFRPNQADVEGRDLSVFEPGAEEEVPTAEFEAGDFVRSSES